MVIADLSSEGESCIVARGGRGGVGNLAFASATDQAPKKATNGTEGDNKSIEVELKTIADVGMVCPLLVGVATSIVGGATKCW